MQLADYRVANPALMDMLAPPDAQNRYLIKQQLEVQKVIQTVQQVCKDSIDTNVKTFTSNAQHAKHTTLTALI